jgi:hypothetical protein
MYPITITSLVREKIGDQSVSRQRAVLAMQRPQGYELVPTFLHSGLIQLSGDKSKGKEDYMNIDPNEDVMWMYTKCIDGKNPMIQVPDLEAKIGCIKCHKPLPFSIYDSKTQSQGLYRIQFLTESQVMHVIPVFWRTCSKQCDDYDTNDFF